jgi:GT2 family glycosyltransferase/SAM-dependent methyltransferase
VSAEPYGRQYYETACGPVPYDRAEPHWLAFFGAIADRIVADIAPRTVLDVGCAKGFLVEALRDRGVEAFGLDISDYAIGEVRPDIRAFCRVASASDPLPQRYDLIVCIEVLEHMPASEGERAIAHMAHSTGDVLFSSTPDDFEEPTHVNVRPRSHWIERFADQGFHLDAEFDAGFVAPHAMRFRTGRPDVSVVDALLAQGDRRRAELAHLRGDRAALGSELARLRGDLAARERVLAVVEAELARLRGVLADRESAIAAAGARLASLRRAHEERIASIEGERDGLLAERAALRERETHHLADIRDARAELDLLRARAAEDAARIGHLTAYVRLVHGTVSWKMLERARRWRDRLAPDGSASARLYGRVRDRLRARPGEPRVPPSAPPEPAAAMTEAADAPPSAVAEPAATPEPEPGYGAWLRRHALGPERIAAMRREVEGFTYRPRVSLITPVYNTPEEWLRRMVASVQSQVYPDWELCLVDDGSTDPGVMPALRALAAADPRIRVERSPRNEGIAGASARALGMATGEFVALLDHDDELSPDALFQMVARLRAEPDLDLLYSDEDKLDAGGQRVEPFFKPGWSPDLLLSMNYIAHLTVVRRSLLEAAGGFRQGFDGSQDYDLLLRVTERTSRIAHVPLVLYHWRKAAGSAAASPLAKPFAQAAAERALADALRRRGREGWVEGRSPGRHVVRYTLHDRPLVSVIIPTRDRLELLRSCLESVEQMTDYAPYEILVVDNDSVEPATREYLEAGAGRWRVVRCPGPFNFARINNVGVAAARGDHYLFLNNDTQVRREDWLLAMVEQAQRLEVGAVGARLLYPDGRIQHAGVVLGVGGVAGHAFKYRPGGASMHFDLPHVVRNVSAVTAACMLVPRRVLEDVGGFDERLAVAFNDVDLCCRIRARGYLIVYTPLAELFHLESASRKQLHPPADEELMWARWGATIKAGDPYYNPNLTLTHEDWSIAP